MQKLKYGWHVLRDGVKGFVGDSCFRYSAALSFYTLFSIAPVVLISIHAAGFLVQDFDFQQQVSAQFQQMLGERGAEGITVLMDSLQDDGSSKTQLIISICILLFSATNIFIQLQMTFNTIFSVRVQAGKSLISQIWDRIISLGLLLSLGFVMIISLLIDSVIASLETLLNQVVTGWAVYVASAAQFILLAGLFMLIVYSLLSFLPDVTIKKRYKLQGAAIITTMFILGKSVINWYIGNSRFSELAGASASVIVLMLWVYYSSMILFFGAELIKAMAANAGVKLAPRRYAVAIKTVTVKDDEDGESERVQEKDLEPGQDQDLDQEQDQELALARGQDDERPGDKGAWNAETRHKSTQTS